MGNSILTEYRLELGFFLVLIFSISTALGVLWLISGSDGELEGVLSSLQSLIDPLGNWAYWLIAIGPIGLAISLWWLSDYFSKSRKLSKLIDTTSKAKFIKSMDDIEYIAWRLPKRFKLMVSKKKSELKIRK